MSTLARAIGLQDNSIDAPGLTYGSLPAPVTIDSENLLITADDPGATTFSVSRGQNGSAPAAHSLGATVSAGWGGGGASDLEAVLAEGNETGEHTIVLPMATIDGTTDNGELDVNATAGADGEGARLTLLLGQPDDNGAASIHGGTLNTGNGGANIRANGATSGHAGHASIQGGTAGSGTGSAGGDVQLSPGAGDGIGRAGLVFLNLSTSDPEVAGALYEDSVTHLVTVSQG